MYIRSEVNLMKLSIKLKVTTGSDKCAAIPAGGMHWGPKIAECCARVKPERFHRQL